MSDETPGNASAGTPTVPPGSGAAESGSGVTGTPAASSPSSSTASPPATSPDSSTGTGEASGGEAFDFGAMFADAPPEIPKAPPTPAAAKPEVVAPTPKPAEVPPASPPTAAPVEAQTPPKPQGPTPAEAQPQAPALDSYDPASLSNHLAANEEAAVEFTAENVFKLSPKEIEALETNMAEAVPRLMAKAFVKSQLNALSQMARIVPAMIQKQTAVLKQNAENETKFYSRWPDIKPDKHGDLVRKYAAVYRQMHPQTTLEQMVEDLGPMVMMAARVVPQVGGSPAAGHAANPVSQPASPAGRSPPPPPFVPAGAGATNSSKAPELNPIEVMFQDHG